MRRRVAWIPCFLLLLGCGSPEPETFDAHVTFSILGGKPSLGGPVTSKRAVTFLAVEKAGRTPIVNTWQEEAGEGACYGRHNFPPNSGASALASYYVVILANAGWKREADYEFDEQTATLRFFGVRHLDAAADIDEIRIVVQREATSGG